MTCSEFLALNRSAQEVAARIECLMERGDRGQEPRLSWGTSATPTRTCGSSDGCSKAIVLGAPASTSPIAPSRTQEPIQTKPVCVPSGHDKAGSRCCGSARSEPPLGAPSNRQRNSGRPAGSWPRKLSNDSPTCSSLPCLALWTIPQSSARHDPTRNRRWSSDAR